MKLIYSLRNEIVSLNKLQKHFLDASISSISAEDADLLAKYISFFLNCGHSLSYLAKCYDTIVKDTLKEQIYFRKHKKYKYSTYDEVALLVYENDEYMKLYMHGLALTSFLWPNHAKIKTFFTKTLPIENRGAYLEIGPGHGIYFMEAMRLSEYNKYLGIDISPTSVALTKQIIESGYFGNFSNYDIIESDFLQFATPDKFDSVIMGEVLEHVENPEAFLVKIREITHSKSHIYVTTCINAPAIDHIYLFNNFEEIRAMIIKSGFLIKEYMLLPSNDLSIEENVKDNLPINVALTLRKP